MTRSPSVRLSMNENVRRDLIRRPRQYRYIRGRAELDRRKSSIRAYEREVGRQYLLAGG